MKYMLLTGLLLGSLTVQAQVSGTVKDQAGEPIIGANVFWKNIPGGVATREDGTFSLSTLTHSTCPCGSRSVHTSLFSPFVPFCCLLLSSFRGQLSLNKSFSIFPVSVITRTDKLNSE